jgi:hypothetical protein
MEWLSVIGDILVPLISALFGGIGGYYGAKRSITAPFREHLYTRQIDAYIVLMNDIEEIKLTTTHLLAHASIPSKEIQIPSELNKLSQSLFRHSRSTPAILLPNDVHTEINSFLGKVSDIHDHLRFHLPLTPNYHFEQTKDILNSYEQLIQIVREKLGTERLSRDTLKLINEPIEAKANEASSNNQSTLEAPPRIILRPNNKRPTP